MTRTDRTTEASHPTHGSTATRSTGSVRLAASPDAAPRVREWVCAELRRADWPASCRADAALAVDEAVQNAVEHGSEPDAEIRVALAVEGDVARIRVRDRGRPGAAPPTGPLVAPGDDAIRGRGRLIMANLADVDWQPADGGGTEVRLHICADASAPGDASN
ncbi:MAG TPA: ATP-binding protein [Miltoncostaea sp.]|nr:ATP-binding protein [Miltoncostaea sp.]